MIEFFQYWSALVRAPLLSWAIGVQLLAVTTALALQFVGWQARRVAFVCVPLGTLSWLVLSVPLLILGWGLGGWDDWDNSPPPGFVDLTWLYFAGLETGVVLLALGTALLHRKQFSLSLLRGFCGFFLDALLYIAVFACEVSTILPLAKDASDRIFLFFILNGFVIWLFFLWMRPTMLKMLKRARLTRHPKAHGLT